MTYTEKIIIYIDILGFKELIDSTINESNMVDKSRVTLIANIYKSISKLCNKYRVYSGKRRLKANLLITRFSDSIVISCNYKDAASIWSMTLITREIAQTLLKFNVIVRGAVTTGKIYHTKNLLFGPGLVDAYLKESKHAKFPRIIFDEKVAQQINKYDHVRRIYWYTDNNNDKFIKVDSDNIWYMDYFTIYPSETSGIYSNPKLIFNHIENLRKTILRGLDQAKMRNDHNILNKYLWMIDKYNETINYYKQSGIVDFFYRHVSHYTNQYWYKILTTKPLNKKQHITAPNLKWPVVVRWE